MRLALFSPLNPQQSGISDYTEELLPYLSSAGVEIDLYVEGFSPTNEEALAAFRIFDYVRDPSQLDRLRDYDAVLYHLGNDHRYHGGIYDVARRHPGVIVFHDFALQDFFLGLARARGDFRIYLDELEACEGAEARPEAAEAFARGSIPAQAAAPLTCPLNQRLAREAEGIIVHSQWSRERFQLIAPSTPIAQISHHITARAARAGAAHADTRTRDASELNIASFGLITPDKGIERALRALSRLRERHAFHYTLAGAPNSYFDVRGLVSRYGLTERVTITDHLSLPEFERRIAETDIAINLRERTVGETSGSLCRIMAAGVAAIVSNTGWFAELPADTVVHVDMDEYADALLHAFLERLIEDGSLRQRIGVNARRHVLAAHTIERSAAGYLAFIREVAGTRARRRVVGAISVEAARLGIEAQRDEALLRGIAEEVTALAPAKVLAAVHPAHSSFFAGHASALTSKSAAAGGDGGPTHTAGSSESSSHSLETPAPSMERASPEHSSPETALAPEPAATPPERGRLRKIEGIDYKRAAVEYPHKLDAERLHYLLTKPFYNLANKPPKHIGDGMDEETHRHFSDFINMAVALALPPGSRILDVGCGSGWLSEYFARLGYDVTGIDISSDLLHIARERVARVAYRVDHETPLRCRFIAHDVESAPLPETFDAVVCYDSLHHFVDEHAVMRHLSAMSERGGLLFILEGDKPPDGSATEEELLDVMRRYETLESPFSRDYLHALLREHGFAVIGDYVSVNGLFERDQIEDGRLRVAMPEINYLLCKKISDGGALAPTHTPDSRNPGKLSARIQVVRSDVNERGPVATGTSLNVRLEVENTGDTIWLTGPATRRGAVMLAVKWLDESGNTVRERHGEPPLPRAVAPGESVSLSLDERAPDEPGRYRLKIDMVAEHVAWFESKGSEPLVLTLDVV